MHAVDGSLVPAFHAALPFPLTDDQTAAIAQITDDMARPAPMHRLLQGEVGSGKTVVALTALLVAVQGGYQGAFMAPTEVLAEQHELTMRALLGELSVVDDGTLLGERPVNVALLTNRTPAADRRRIADGLRAGTVDILVGTHALIYGGVEFARLGRRGDRRAAPLRRRAARPAARQGRLARRAGDDGHADPAHRGDADLRRSRQDRAAPPTCRPFADRHDGGRRRTARTRSRSTRRCARRWRRAGRPTSCARWSRDPTSSRRAPPPRSWSACGRRSSPTCASVCCTARCPRPRRKRRCARSATARPTCSWRRP